ncbi:MAG: lamin tail domain-containing protein [Leptolyngbya sp. PLA1]|nr:lamin tail domain-containing protein [Leptolyngbya sp. PLA1]
MTKSVCVCVGALMAFAGAASAQVRITEWAYSALDGEFIEFTNVGGAPVDLSTYSYDDDSRLAGTVGLAAMGILQPGESAILTEVLASDFRAAWSLPASVKILGGNVANLGRNDEINLFDGFTLVDRLTFGDQNIPGTIRTQNTSGITTPANWGANNVAGWFFSVVGDSYGSRRSLNGDVGSPGAIPTPGTLALVGLGCVVAGRRRR